MIRRRSTLFIPVVAAAAAMLTAVPAIAEDDAQLELVRQKVDEMFDMIAPENVKTSPVDGWYTIQKGSVIAYISSDGRYLLQGDLIDLDNQLNLSEATRTDARRKLMATVTDDEVIAFTPSEVKYSVTVFTDVDCTYCRRLHSQIEEYMAHGIEIRYMLYPRNGPASPSWNTSEEVWCANDRADALTLAKLDKDFKTSKCDSTIVQDHYVIGRDVGLNGTPAIVFDDGTLVAGYLPPDQLAERLEQNAARQ
jgi:thiol:disulfide interchange protein DsbC